MSHDNGPPPALDTNATSSNSKRKNLQARRLHDAVEALLPEKIIFNDNILIFVDLENQPLFPSLVDRAGLVRNKKNVILVFREDDAKWKDDYSSFTDRSFSAPQETNLAELVLFGGIARNEHDLAKTILLVSNDRLMKSMKAALEVLGFTSVYFVGGAHIDRVALRILELKKDSPQLFSTQ